MKVLVACEYSGIVRDAFLARGHDAISCDLLPTESPGPHVQGDVRPLLRERWDLVIAHPPCQYLSHAGARWYADRTTTRFFHMMRGLDFFWECLQANSRFTAVENPPMYSIAKQEVPPFCFATQPWEFGHPWRKKHLWWTRGGLPPLMPNMIRTTYASYWKRYRRQTDVKTKSRFFEGIAEAMAKQWGAL